MKAKFEETSVGTILKVRLLNDGRHEVIHPTTGVGFITTGFKLIDEWLPKIDLLVFVN